MGFPTIDSKQATEALNEIDDIVRRVRQSRIYNVASLMMIMWGALTCYGYVATALWPRYAGYAWLSVYVVGIAGWFTIGALGYKRSGVSGFDLRTLAAFVLFFAFGFLWTTGLVHFTPRQLSAFWPIYFMLVYTIVGLWVGWAFSAIGLGITALTLIGYFFAGTWFELWMAVVNGGGLMLGGLWMRRS
jgi:hypothetical protein